MKCLSPLIHLLNTTLAFIFKNPKYKNIYLFIFIALRSSTYSTKIAVKWTIIMLQRSVIPIWNPESQGYKIGYVVGNKNVPKMAQK